MRLRARNGIPQRKAAPRRKFDTRVGEGRDSEIRGLFAEQDGKSGGRIHARGLTLLREPVVHRTRHVHDESGRAGKLLESGDALEHGLFERVFERPSVAGRCQETERQRPRDALVQPLADKLRVDARCEHQAEVAQDGQAAEFTLAQEAFEVLAPVLPCGQGNLPGIGRLERVLNELLPERRLRVVLGLRVAEEQHVAELHDRFAVVFGKLVGVELRERPRQPALDARRKRLLCFLPVERDELAEFIGSLDHVLERFGYERACALAARELANQEERCMAELHLVTRLARESGHNFRLVLGGERGHALRDVAALLVAGVFPEQTREHGAPEFAPRVHFLRHRPLVRPHREKPLPYVHFCHCHSSFHPPANISPGGKSSRVAGRQPHIVSQTK